MRPRTLLASIGIVVMAVAVAAGGSGSSIGAGTVFLPNPVGFSTEARSIGEGFSDYWAQ